jgi:hypothetical protein
MADPTVARRVLQVEHTKIVSAKKFADVVTALEASIPKLDDAIAEALAKGDERRATELEKGTPLFIFLKRDHGGAAAGHGAAAKGISVRYRQSAHSI